jgi:hypothetical protein
MRDVTELFDCNGNNDSLSYLTPPYDCSPIFGIELGLCVTSQTLAVRLFAMETK